MTLNINDLISVDAYGKRTSDHGISRSLHEHIAHWAYLYWQAMVKSRGVDFGPWYYWFYAEWSMGLIPYEPLPPGVVSANWH